MRASGVLMHISSLPSDFGIGTLGKYAYEFVDRLKESSQTYWQILPLCPTSFGASPYQSFSTFAGNPFFIDLDILCEQGYLAKEDYQNINWSDSDTMVDYERLEEKRNEVFGLVYKNFLKRVPSAFYAFCQKKAWWLDDFALFMAIKDSFGGVSFEKWDSDIKKRQKSVLEQYKQKLKNEVIYYKMLQFFFFEQWGKLKKYANENGIKIIGDLPIYVALDSADVWSNPKQFYLDKNFSPVEVAGCPPDGFSPTGQLWGNPLYNWKNMKLDGYSWWLNRMRESLEMCDIVRIDHFRGFDSYYCIPAGDKTAENGKWRKGPGMDFFNTLQQTLGEMPLIAEDLGFLTDSVIKLLKDSGYPGMKVLQFAFNPGDDNVYLPHNHIKNCVVYTGTHDNNTINGWVKEQNDYNLSYVKSYINYNENKPFHWAFMGAALASVADTAIVTMQDILGLDEQARMNTPSTLGGNWAWRAKKEDLKEENFRILKEYTHLYYRNSK